jgi:hypothetical protein
MPLGVNQTSNLNPPVRSLPTGTSARSASLDFQAPPVNIIFRHFVSADFPIHPFLPTDQELGSATLLSIEPLMARPVQSLRVFLLDMSIYLV